MNLTNKQRRRINRLVRRIGENYGCVFLRSPCDIRDARRIGRMGLACPVITKTWFGVGAIKEVALYPSRATASERYPAWTMPERSRRGI